MRVCSTIVRCDRRFCNFNHLAYLARAFSNISTACELSSTRARPVRAAIHRVRDAASVIRHVLIFSFSILSLLLLFIDPIQFIDFCSDSAAQYRALFARLPRLSRSSRTLVFSFSLLFTQISLVTRFPPYRSSSLVTQMNAIAPFALPRPRPDIGHVILGLNCEIEPFLSFDRLLVRDALPRLSLGRF